MIQRESELIEKLTPSSLNLQNYFQLKNHISDLTFVLDEVHPISHNLYKCWIRKTPKINKTTFTAHHTKQLVICSVKSAVGNLFAFSTIFTITTTSQVKR